MWGLLALGWGVALAFRPWKVLQHQPLQSPFLAALVILPWLWWTQKLLPSGMALHLSGVCLMVLMFGWPLAVLMVLPVATSAVLIEIYGPQRLSRAALAVPPTPPWDAAWDLLLTRADAMAEHMVWMGLAPATVALGLGLLMRRYLPMHLFVFILGRAFFGTALAISAVGVMGWLAGRVPPGTDVQDWVLGHWLLGFGEAFSTGMLVAIFVAFKPQWLLTYSDARYLPGPQPPTGGNHHPPP